MKASELQLVNSFNSNQNKQDTSQVSMISTSSEMSSNKLKVTETSIRRKHKPVAANPLSHLHSKRVNTNTYILTFLNAF